MRSSPGFDECVSNPGAKARESQSLHSSTQTLTADDTNFALSALKITTGGSHEKASDFLVAAEHMVRIILQYKLTTVQQKYREASALTTVRRTLFSNMS